MIDLFPKDQVVGFFRGFHEGGLEFHADLALPYRTSFNAVPMHGQFLIVQLESENEAILGRITALSSEGRLTSSAGERFTMRAIREDRQIDEGLREEYLTYRVNIRVLGVVRVEGGKLRFVPSHRRLPHVGSQVAFLSDRLLAEISGHNEPGAPFGFLALGEYVYAAGDGRLAPLEWMQVKDPLVEIKFEVDRLVRRRTFIFARAGFGKSNLNKLLFAQLYRDTPTVQKRGDRSVPVGTILFDPDGEYFWPDDNGRPGLCDVPELRDKLVVFTSQAPPSGFYGSFVAGGIRLDIRRLRPADVVTLTLPEEKHDQQNVVKIRGLDQGRWAKFIDLIHRSGNSADLDEIKELLRLESGQDFEALAARANTTRMVNMLHDPTSQMMDMLLLALSEGKLCVVDVSQMRGGAALSLSGLILRRIFDRNQEEFTKADPKSIPTIAVVEEAQSVLNEHSSACRPYVEWVKEGRKYDLGAVLITQQPGSIPAEILSQGDNWFLFHLLSAGDLKNVQRANAHFSDDLLSALLNEPIPGQGIFWSSVSGRPYPVPFRALSFEGLYERQDAEYRRAAVDTYARELRAAFETSLGEAASALSGTGEDVTETPVMSERTAVEVPSSPDAFNTYKRNAIEALRQSDEFQRGIKGAGFPWGGLVGILERALPTTIEDRNGVAFGMVADALEEILGPKGTAWDAEKRPTKSGKTTTMVYRIGDESV